MDDFFGLDSGSLIGNTNLSYNPPSTSLALSTSAGGSALDTFSLGSSVSNSGGFFDSLSSGFTKILDNPTAKSLLTGLVNPNQAKVDAANSKTVPRTAADMSSGMTFGKVALFAGVALGVGLVVYLFARK